MKEIQLTQGKIAIVDDCDFEWLSGWKWYAKKAAGGLWYAARNDYVNGTKQPPKTVRMHRELAKAMSLPHVDHQDGDGLHNWRENLRPCSCSQNQINRGPQRNNTSGFKGVSWHKVTQMWIATIRFQGKSKHLGCFPSPVKAAVAYDEKAFALFGDFAKLNFPNRAATRLASISNSEADLAPVPGH